MKAYSLDLRERVVAAVEAGGSELGVARRFAVGRSTVHRWTTQQAQTGSLAPKPIPGRPRKIPPADEPALAAQLDAQPDATLAEHCAQWEALHQVAVSCSTMHHALARLNWSLKTRPSTPASKTRVRGTPTGSRRSFSTRTNACSSTRPVPGST